MIMLKCHYFIPLKGIQSAKFSSIWSIGSRTVEWVALMIKSGKISKAMRSEYTKIMIESPSILSVGEIP